MSRLPHKRTTDSFAHKKSLGQNFLTSDVVPTWMCDAATISATDTVVEIGPGTGALTKVLLARGALVYAIETDERAVTILNETFAEAIAAGQLIIIATDIRTADINTFPFIATPYKIVANIPYYLTGFLFRRFLEQKNPPTTLVFLIQKEVAWRIARDRKESLLSLSIKAFGTPRYIKTVSRGHFQPAPNVDSAIIAVTDISPTAFLDDAARTAFFTHLHLGFGQKRKQLLGNLGAVYDRSRLEALFDTLGLSRNTRAEDLSVKEWQRLSRALSTFESH